LTESIVFVTC